MESVPAEEKLTFKQSAQYMQWSKMTSNSVTTWRNLMFGEIYYPLEEYPDLRKFYSDFEHKDHASIVLKRTAAPGTAAGTSGGE